MEEMEPDTSSSEALSRAFEIIFFNFISFYFFL